MAAYPLAGYFAARYLIERFGLPKFTMAALITIGFVASVRETIRIIRLAIKAQGKN